MPHPGRGGAVRADQRRGLHRLHRDLHPWRHPPSAASLRVPGLTLLLARLDGQPVGAAIAASDATVLNVAGVAVLEKARRQGIGTQLTLACLATAPHLPAVLASSDDGHPLYRTLGFHDVGPTTLWWRPAHRAT